MDTLTRHRAIAPWLAFAAAILILAGAGMWALRPAGTVPVYSQTWQGDHYLGRYVCTNTADGGVACDGLPADLGPYVQCRVRPDGPNREAFVRCGQHPDSNRFDEAK